MVKLVVFVSLARRECEEQIAAIPGRHGKLQAHLVLKTMTMLCVTTSFGAFVLTFEPHGASTNAVVFAVIASAKLKRERILTATRVVILHPSYNILPVYMWRLAEGI